MSDIFVDATLSTEKEHPVSYSCCIEQGLCCVRERKIANLGEKAERLRDLCPAASRLPSVSPFCCHHTDHISFSKKLLPFSPSFQPFPFLLKKHTKVISRNKRSLETCPPSFIAIADKELFIL